MLPPVSSEIEQNDMGSSASLNTISAAEEETKQTLWMRIKSKVKKGIATKLQQSNILSRAGYEQPGYQKEIARRVQLIDLLMVLFPIDDILDLYIKTRLNKLEQVSAGTKKQSVSWADDEDIEKVCVSIMVAPEEGYRFIDTYMGYLFHRFNQTQLLLMWTSIFN